MRAATSCTFGALNRKGREPLVRYCLRPAIANERLSILKDGSIADRTKYPRGRRTHRVMLPMEFMARLAAIVPPPRFLLWRQHSVVAPPRELRFRGAPERPARRASVVCLALCVSGRRPTDPQARPVEASSWACAVRARRR